MMQQFQGLIGLAAVLLLAWSLSEDRANRPGWRWLGGALLLTASDMLVRIIPSTNELKLGVVTAFLGVPVFLAHLLRERRLW